MTERRQTEYDKWFRGMPEVEIETNEKTKTNNKILEIKCKALKNKCLFRSPFSGRQCLRAAGKCQAQDIIYKS